MQQQTRSELDALTYGNLPNNTAGAIDPAKLREVILSLIASQLNLLDDGNPGAGPGAGTPASGQQQATFGNLGGQAQDNPSLVTYLASLGHALLEFTPPLLTQARQWYLTSTGIWEAKSSFNAQASPAAGAYWRLVVGFGDALTATAAGKALLAAPTALAQRNLLDIFTATAGQYGTGQPGFTNAYAADGVLVYLLRQVDYLRTQVVGLATPAQPALPIVTGFLPSSGAVGASITITGSNFSKVTAVLFNGTPASFQLINATTIVAVVPTGATTGPVAVTNGAGTGTSASSFEVKTSTTTLTPTPDLTAALAISVASLTLGASVAYSVTPAKGTAPYTYEVVATDTATGQAFTLGTTKTGNWTPTAVGSYAVEATVTDSSSPAQIAQSAIRYLQVVQAANRIPVADAGSDVTIQLPTSSLALMGRATDPDGDAITGHAWRQVMGPNNATGLPASTQNVVASNLVEGTYQFGYRATDSRGGQSDEDFVLVTVQAAASGGGGGTGKATQRYLGDSNTEGNVITGDAYPVVARKGLDPSIFPPSAWRNAGHSGESPDKLLTRLQAEIIDQNKTGTDGFTQDIVGYAAGVNAARVGDDYSLHFGLFQTPEEIAHDILEAGRRMRLSGIRPFLVSAFYDRQVYSSNPQEDARRVAIIDAVNNILAANWKKYGFLLFLDLRNGLLSATAPLPAANGGTAGTKYNPTDGIHLSNEGQADLGALIIQAVQTVYAMTVPAFPDQGEYKYSNEWVPIANVSVSGNTLTTVSANTTFTAAARSVSRIPYTNVTTRLGRRTFTNSSGQDKTFGLTSVRTQGGAWQEQDYVFYTSTNGSGIVRVFYRGDQKFVLATFSASYIFHLDVYADRIEFILDKGDGTREGTVFTQPRFETTDLFATVGMQGVAGSSTSITSAPAVNTPVVAYPNGIRALNPINGSFVLQTSTFTKDAGAGEFFNAQVQSREAFGAVASGAIGRLEWKTDGKNVTGIYGAPQTNTTFPLAGIHKDLDGATISVRKYGTLISTGSWHPCSGTEQFSAVLTVNAADSTLADISFQMDGVEFDSSQGVPVPFPCRFGTIMLNAGSKVSNIRLFATNPTV